jgi:hypothetical protein
MKVRITKALNKPAAVSLSEMAHAMEKLTPSEFKTLWAILTRETIPGKFVISWKRLRELTGLSQKTVALAVRTLVDKKFINVELQRSTGVSGWYRSSLMENLDMEKFSYDGEDHFIRWEG